MEVMECPKCGSPDIIRNGNNRVKCKTCNRSSSVYQEAVATNEDNAWRTKADDRLKEIKKLRNLNAQLREENSDLQQIRSFIHSIKPDPKPAWLRTVPKGKKRGTPTLFLSDLHWGERVYANQVGGVNTFDMPTARARLRTVTDTFLQMCFDELARPDYPGVIAALGGDLISGYIHEELKHHADGALTEQVIDVVEHLQVCLSTLADEFGRVYVPCVVGNHGRLDRKPPAKNAVKENLEWLAYEFLRKFFQDDNRVTFTVATGLDLLYSVHGFRYLLTHGDQFKGGTGITGPLLPQMRGKQKKDMVYSATNRKFDCMIMGHWHHARMLNEIIVNGSLVGYDEYAFKMNFGFQPPQQTMWITDPRHGIWYWNALDAEKVQPMASKTDWVRVAC